MSISQSINNPDAITLTRGEMLRDFCQLMEREGIIYVILSDESEYPHRIDSDVDFMISEDDFQRLPMILGRLDAVPGAQLIQMFKHEIGACYYIFAKQVGHKIAYLHPDASAGYRRKGRLWLRCDEVLASRRKSLNDFWIPSPSILFEYYLIKRVDKHNIGNAHTQRLFQLMSEDTSGCTAVADRLFGTRLGALLVDGLIRQDSTAINSSLSRLHTALVATPHLEPLNRRVVVRATEALRKLQRVTLPTGLVVSVLGPDGSGKTTVIEHLELEFAQAFRRVCRFHLRPRTGGNTGRGPVVNPHEQPPRGVPASILKLLFFWFDYLVGWLRKVWPAKVRSTLVLFDRYFHDMMIDQRRYRLPENFRLIKIVELIIPKPDVWIVLTASPSSLVARKGEVSLESARTLSAGYAAFAVKQGLKVVNTDYQLETTLAEVVARLLQHLHSRVQRQIFGRQ